MRPHYVPPFMLADWVGDAKYEKFQEFRVDLPSIRTNRKVPKATGYVEDIYVLAGGVLARFSE